ncbi:hypothetical protein GCM10010297_55800 [Streptomyces malachitofuscus]|nr:hypothetical protein GCM10010297_55800 [Streptomyces malachitofuscus]
MGVSVLGLARLSLLVEVRGADAPATAGEHPHPTPPPADRAAAAIRGQSCLPQCLKGLGGTPRAMGVPPLMGVPPARAQPRVGEKPRVGEGGRDGTPLAPGCADTPRPAPTRPAFTRRGT